MTPVEELISAWEVWDEKPGSVDIATRRLRALKAVDSDWLRLHRRVDVLRREGLSARDAIHRAVGEAS